MKKLQSVKKPIKHKSATKQPKTTQKRVKNALSVKKTPLTLVITKPTKKRNGRPPIKITKRLLETAEEYAMQGMFAKDIAAALGIGENTYYKLQAKFIKFREAISTGRARGIVKVSSLMMAKIEAGGNEMIKLYMNTSG